MSRKKNTKPNINTTEQRDAIVSFLDKELRTSQIRDYSCNGLQVEGSEKITKIGFSVDACIESYKQAIAENCQMLIVHHGIIWDGIRSIRGSVRNQLQFLLENNLNLYASHLPLDLHPTLGNNAGLGKILRVTNMKPFGLYKGIEIGFQGKFRSPKSLDIIVQTLCESLDTECTVLPFGPKKISSIALISGGGGTELTQSINQGIDCFVTGEPVHQNYHEALEGKVNVIYAGHYHTEKPGVQSLAKLCKKQFRIKTVFIDIPSSI